MRGHRESTAAANGQGARVGGQQRLGANGRRRTALRRGSPAVVGSSPLLLVLVLQLLQAVVLLPGRARAFALLPSQWPPRFQWHSLGAQQQARPQQQGRPVCARRGHLAMKKEDAGVKKPIKRVCATNKYAKSSYEIGKKFEAGISLVGTEVAPIVSGSCQLRDAYCRVKDGELWIHNLFVGPHPTTGKYFQHQEKRPRRLLVHKKEIVELRNAAEREGQTIVPLRIYLNGDHRIKVEIAIGRGMKKYDKREQIKERELKRGFERILKSF